MKATMGTDENKDAVCILLPAIGHFFVFFLGHPHIHIEDRPRAIRDVGRSMRGLIWC